MQSPMSSTQALEPDARPAGPRGATAPDPLGLHALAVSFVATAEASPALGQWWVRSGGQRFCASLAFSCLVEPALGDQVACWRSPDGGGVHIVAILSRCDETAPQTLRFAARSQWHAGDLKLHSQTLEVQTNSANLAADSANLVTRSLLCVGELCKSTWGQLKLAGASLSTTFDQQVHHARIHQRTVDGLDRTHAQVLEQQADELVHVRAPTVLTEGDRVVKTRGAQIHFG
jgi:Protein of unknown function (DUF3540)